MIDNARIVREALSHKGSHEDPMGSNTGPFVILCQRATFLGGTKWPWCAAFVCYVCERAGVPLAYNGAGAHDLADHHPPSVPQNRWEPGMVVDFNIGSGHTGILVSHTATSVKTVDGNWGDAVTEHDTPTSFVRKVWAIPGVSYKAGTAPTPPKKKLPAWVVTTSAKGTQKVVFRAAKKSQLVRWLTTHNLARLFPNGVTIKRGKG